MKKGKTFESIARIIYESLNDLEGAIINENVILKDQSGTFREIDILVESTIFDTKIKIAIECKDHNRPVSRSVVDSFYAKCKVIPEINKLIIISKSGYQKGAISGAKLLGIDIYDLSALTASDILNWLGIVDTQGYEIERRITKIALEFSNNKIQFEPDETLVQYGKKLQITLIEYVTEYINNKFPYDILLTKSSPYDIRKPEIKEFYFVPEELSILKNGVESNITRILGEITDMPIPVKTEIIINKFKENDSDLESQIISMVSERGDITSFIRKKEKLQIISKIKFQEFNNERTKIIKHK